MSSIIGLEDSNRRIHDRLEQLQAIGTDKLLIYTHWHQGEKGLEDLRLLLACRPYIRVVIVDPIVRFIDLLDFNDYGGAYGALTPLKDLLDARKVAGIFSTHCRKGLSDLDAFDSILGSTGWGAACDTRLVLRRQRGSPEGTLVAGGRDVIYSEHALQFDPYSGWTYQGLAEDVQMSSARREIIDLLAEGPLSATEIAKRLEKNYNTTRNLLAKLQDAGKVFHDAEDGHKWRCSVVTVVSPELKPATLTTLTTPTKLTIPTTLRRGGNSSMSRKHPHSQTPHYLNKLLSLAGNTQLIPGIHVARILHDDWCDQLTGRGPCNCNPEVRLPPTPGRN